MKKSKLWVALAALFVVLVGAGCSNNSSSSSSSSSNYSSLMREGKNFVAEKKYSQAEDKFEDAHDAKATTESKAYADQAEEMADAQDEISEYEFSSALKDLNKAITINNGYSVMVKQAKNQYKTISRVNNNIKNEINPLYRRARAAFNNNNYSQAQELCTQILDLPYINTKYYKQIRNKVEDLLQDAQDANSDSSSNSSNEASTSQSSSAASSSSSTNNSSNSNSGSTNSMTVGGQAVPARVIAQVRDKLSSIGVDTSAWNDQEVVNFMNSAANNGHTTIDSYTQSDVNNFLK